MSYVFMKNSIIKYIYKYYKHEYIYMQYTPFSYLNLKFFDIASNNDAYHRRIQIQNKKRKILIHENTIFNIYLFGDKQW